MPDSAANRPTHGGYQDPFEAADLLPIAREIAAGVMERAPDFTRPSFADRIRAAQLDDDHEVQCALAALKWRFYAQADFRAAVTR